MEMKSNQIEWNDMKQIPKKENANQFINCKFSEGYNGKRKVLE